MKKSLIFFSVSCMISVALWSGYAAWHRTVRDESATVASIQNRITARIETTDRIASAPDVLSEIADDEKVIRNYFLPETEVVSFTARLKTIGETQRASLTVLSASPAAVDSRPMLSLNLAVTGPFDAVMRTVGAIEYMPYDLSITRLSLKQEGEIWRASLTLRVGSLQANTP